MNRSLVLLYGLPLLEPAPPRVRRPWKIRRVLACVIASFLTAAGAGTYSYLQGLWATLPVVNAESLRAEQSIRILDREGRELYRVFEREDRVAVPSDKIAQTMKDAIVAIEDERFFSRPCVDPIALLRAARANASDFKSQGASTITQQLVRNAFLEREKKISRKLQEIMLACRLEGEMDKHDILTMYLNRVSFGQSIHGVAQAANAYFGVEPADLTVAQAAVLAALPQRPSYYTPYGGHVRTIVLDPALGGLRNGTRTVASLTDGDVELGLIGVTVQAGSGVAIIDGRADAVLRSMRRLGYLNEHTFLQARAQLHALTFKPRDSNTPEAPHFTLLVRDKVMTMMEQRGEEDSWTKAGLRVKTTLDLDLQRTAEQVVADLFPVIGRRAKAGNVALIALDRRTRDVLAYVGSTGYFGDGDDGKIDMVQAPRQPGSIFKPFVYAAAFMRGLKSAGTIDDTPLKIGTQSPKNYDGLFVGRMTVKSALAWSRNIPAIRAFQKAGGESPVLSLISAAGMLEPSRSKARRSSDGRVFEYGWALALGAAEVPLSEMIQGYATLANAGTFLPMRTILSIDDAGDQPLYRPPEIPGLQAIPDEAAIDVAEILGDPKNRPAGSWRAALTIPGTATAAKTGTSNVCFKRNRANNCVEYGVNNTWTLGFTDDFVVGVWVGNADNSVMAPQADGLNTAAPIWKEFLIRAGKQR